MFLSILFIDSFTTSPARSSKFDDGNVILFQIKDFAKNIKEPTLTFPKRNCAPKFYAIKSHQANKQSSFNMKMENMLQRFSYLLLIFTSLFLSYRNQSIDLLHISALLMKVKEKTLAISEGVRCSQSAQTIIALLIISCDNSRKLSEKCPQLCLDLQHY